MTERRDDPAAHAGKIGLVGGLAFRAGVFYYERLVQRFAARQARLDLVLGHADVGTVLTFVGTGDRAGLGAYLGSVANTLFDAGARLVAITAVAPHLAIDEIGRHARGPVVNVLDLIPAALQAAGLERVVIFGNRAVMESGAYGAIPASMIVGLAPSMLEIVHTTYSDIARDGKRATPADVRQLEDIAREAIGRGAQAVLLAGTDLSSFYADQPPTYPHLDVARLHIDEIVRVALG